MDEFQLRQLAAALGISVRNEMDLTELESEVREKAAVVADDAGFMHCRQMAEFHPATVNADERSIEMVIATETPVLAFDFRLFELVDEVLLMSGAELDRVRRGKLPLLNAHRRDSIDDQLGSVIDIQAADELVGRAVFSSVETDALTKAAEGHVDGVSVGFQILASQIVEPGETATINGREFTASDARPLKVVTSWLPIEASLVPIGADSQSGTRSLTDKTQQTKKKNEDTNGGTHNMDEETRDYLISQGMPAEATDEEARAFLKNLTRRQSVQNPNSLTEDEARRLAQQAVAEDRQRQADIRGVFEPFIARDGVQAICDELIPEGTVIDARAALHEFLVKSEDNQSRMILGTEDNERRRDCMEAALVVRSGMVRSIDQDTQEKANEYRNYRLFDMATDCLRRAGINDAELRSMDRHSVVTAAFTQQINGRAIGHTSGDFTALLANTAHKLLLLGFEEQPSTWRDWASVRNVSDFKAHDLTALSGFAILEVVADGGEFPGMTLSDKKETVKAQTRGGIFTIGRQTIINDDLDAFTRIPFLQGSAWARTINQTAITKLLANPVLVTDAIALFHATHNNLVTGAAYDPTTTEKAKAGINAMKTKLRKQVGMAGESLNLQPSVVLAGPTGEDYIREAVSDTITTDKDRTPNRGIRGLQVVIDAELENTNIVGASTTAMHLFANPLFAPTVVVALLDGNAAPRLMEMNSWTAEGREYKVAGDVGVGVADFRGAVKSTGA